MSIQQFLTYISYSSIRPDYIQEGRWRGMCRWAISQGYWL